ncbi:amidohydrolase [Parasphingorhabdus pacifica]
MRRYPIDIYTASRVLVGPDAPRAFAVADGTVLATGDITELREAFPGAEITDFGRSTITPGFIDAHMHLGMAAEDLLHLDLSAETAPRKQDLLSSLRAEAGRVRSGATEQWVRGSRYDDAKTGMITRGDLDDVTTELPVFVHHVSAHWGVLNTRALELLGITDPATAPEGGSYGVDEHGRLNGALYERALMNVMGTATGTGPVTIPESSRADRLEGVRRANRMFHAAGLTTICDALASPDDIELYQEARTGGQLSLRTNLLLSINHYDAMRALGVRSGFGDDRLRVIGVKMFADGAVGGRTCLLSEPFTGTAFRGVQTTPTATLHEQVDRVHAAGDRACVHANGDTAIRIVLEAIARAQRRHPRPAPGHRIEHCSVVDDDILRDLAACEVVPVPFGGYPAYHGGALNRWYGPDRADRMFAHRGFRDAGLPVVGSSDYPCGPFEPLVGIQSMVTRAGMDDGEVVGPAQRIPVEEALLAFTSGAATACGAGDRLGRLEPGYRADFAVLERDITAIPAREIAATGVRATFVSGEQVHGS